MDRKEHRSSADNVSGQDKVSKLMNAPAPYLVKTVKEKGKIQKSIRVKLISNDDSKRKQFLEEQKWKTTWREFRNIILISFPMTLDSLWQSAVSLLVNPPTASVSKKYTSCIKGGDTRDYYTQLISKNRKRKQGNESLCQYAGKKVNGTWLENTH